MFKKMTLTLFSLFLLVNISSAQEVWSLEKCVLYARQNNITVQRTEMSVLNNQLVEQGNKQLRYPNLNASIGAGMNFGRTINPVTNIAENFRFTQNNYGLFSQVTIYNGNRINNQIKQSGHDLEASKADLEQIKNDIGLNVATAYLNILFAEEQLKAAETRRELSNQQLEQVDKLINAGARPRNDRLEILAAIARDEQAIIGQENIVETGLLNLKQLLQLDPNFELEIQRPNEVVISADENPDLLKVNELYQSALGNQPFVKADDSRVKSASLSEDIARSNLLPSLRASGNLGTNYADSDNPLFPSQKWGDQLVDNFGQSISLGLSIPIYNQNQTRIGMQQAQLQMKDAQLVSQQNKQNLKTDIQTSVANARAAKRTLEASRVTVDATKAAFENAEKRFQLGAINTFEYATAKNNLDQAEVDLIVAKYDYLFKLKIIDFYLGKPIKID